MLDHGRRCTTDQVLAPMGRIGRVWFDVDTTIEMAERVQVGFGVRDEQSFDEMLQGVRTPFGY